MLEQTQAVTGRAINNISRLLAPRPRASRYARSYGNGSMQPAGVKLQTYNETDFGVALNLRCYPPPACWEHWGASFHHAEVCAILVHASQNCIVIAVMPRAGA